MKSRLLRSRLRESVVVTMKKQPGEQPGVPPTTYAGVLYAEDGAAIALRGATVVAAGERGEDIPLDGEIILLLADVDYIQRP